MQDLSALKAQVAALVGKVSTAVAYLNEHADNSAADKATIADLQEQLSNSSAELDAALKSASAGTVDGTTVSLDPKG